MLLVDWGGYNRITESFSNTRVPRVYSSVLHLCGTAATDFGSLLRRPVFYAIAAGVTFQFSANPWQ